MLICIFGLLLSVFLTLLLVTVVFFNTKLLEPVSSSSFLQSKGIPERRSTLALPSHRPRSLSASQLLDIFEVVSIFFCLYSCNCSEYSSLWFFKEIPVLFSEYFCWITSCQPTELKLPQLSINVNNDILGDMFFLLGWESGEKMDALSC